MKAVQYFRYGGPQTLQVLDVPKPTPGPKQVLVKVKASSVNPLDWHVYRGSPYFLRFMTGLFKPKNKFAGADISGEIVAVGQDVTEHKVGDQVFGDAYPFGYNAWSEYALLELGGLVNKPPNVSHTEVGVCGVAALTAFQALKHQLNVKSGEKILINGASGGVGTYAIQMAKATGAKVTAVCSTNKQEMVQSLGADRVIDYTKTDFANENETYDHILEIVMDHNRKDYRKLLNPGGTCLVIGFKDLNLKNFLKLAGKNLSKKENKTIKTFTAKSNIKDFETIAKWFETGLIRSIIQKEYTLDQIVEACEKLEEGHVAGKLAIVIDRSE